MTSEGLTLALDLWRHPRAGDASVIRRCEGPTLDVGCGPGRMTEALAVAGIPALGIDISNRAVAEARSRGATALHRDVFGTVPAVGRWHHILLMDGNIGIAGDPRALLRRCRESLRDRGTVLVEVEPHRDAIERTTLRLVIDGRPTRRLPWVLVGKGAIRGLAASTSLHIADKWQAAGRHFVALQRRDP